MMKNNTLRGTSKVKIILLSLVVLSTVGFIGTANAASTALSVFPTALTKDAGSQFDISVVANTTGSKVCAVEGKLVFDNLSCESINVLDDVMSQSSPTCTNPYFLIGIPSCTVSDKALISITVKAGNVAGNASAGLTGVDIIDDNGKSISSASNGGNYTIVVPVVPVKPVTPVTPVKPVVPVAPVTPATPTQPVQPTQPVTTQNPQQSWVASVLSAVGNAIKDAIGGILAFFAALWSMFKKLIAANMLFGIILGLLVILLILLIIYLIYLLFKRDDEEDESPKNPENAGTTEPKENNNEQK